MTFKLRQKVFDLVFSPVISNALRPYTLDKRTKQLEENVMEV